MISAARYAAFLLPSIATVATGIPLGIITVASNASVPSRTADFNGTPMTGNVVCADSAESWSASAKLKSTDNSLYKYH